MSRNGSGTYTLPAGNPVVTGTTIEATWANTTLGDIATTLTDSLSRSGQGGMTAALRIADGTQGAPGVGFANETGSGFYRAGTGEVWAVVQGAQTLNLDATGVTVPADKATSIEGTFVFNETGADKDARFEGDTDANLLFIDASTDRVGIGTATPSNKLTVSGNADVTGNFAVGATLSGWSGANVVDIGDRGSLAYLAAAGNFLLLGNNSYWDGTNYKYKATAGAGQLNIGNDGSFSWFNASSGTAGNNISFGNAKMLLDASGNLNVNGTVTATTLQGTLATSAVSQVLQAAYPVGSIYINATNATNPNTLLGFGTWAAFGAGRVPVGFNASNPLFDTAEETGGSADAIVVSHTHTATSTVTDPGHNHTVTCSTAGPGTAGVGNTITASSTATTSTSTTGVTVATTITSTGSSGTNANYQPYITVYMWKRTA